MGVYQRRDTRPLSGSNTDAKCLAYALAYSFCLKIDTWATKLQRGFIRGKNMIHNIIDVDSTAFEYAFLEDDPAIALLDFAAAFPSLSRGFGIFFQFWVSLPLSLWLSRRSTATITTTSPSMALSSTLFVRWWVSDRVVP